MTGVAEGETGGGSARPARRPLNELKPGAFERHPHKLALVQCLRSLIEAADLASKTIASHAKTSPSTVSLNLSGGRLPQRSTVEAIIRLCQVTGEVRAHVLSLHTAALGEAHPVLADRLLTADAYEETVLRHDRVQARLEAVTEEHRRRRADYDDLLARHETTGRALAAARDGLRAQRQHHQEETVRLSALLRQEQDARRRDLTAFENRLHQARAEAEQQLRARKEEEARLRQDLLAHERKLHAARSLLQDSAAEATALRQERDQLRIESARLYEDLVGVQAELAAVQAEQETGGRRDDDTVPTPVGRTFGRTLDRHPTVGEGGEVAGRSPGAGTETRTTADDGNPLPPAVLPDEKPSTVFAPLLLLAGGLFAAGLALLAIGVLQHTGPEARPTTAGWWFICSGSLLLMAFPLPVSVHDGRNTSVSSGDMRDHGHSYEPMA
ncbi:hypothetical protein AB0469_15365 [Streptomyces sp. NPDC093801]|uniref:hypothetical protein n=1 Tax=Streptomyces sp. NPDC093801 TaxID=3155203 RepID=UPI00344EB6F7